MKNNNKKISYANPSYRPSGYSVNGESAAKDVEYFKYDASGNIWYDKHNKVVYKNLELGLPVKITTFTSMPSNIILEDVNEEKDFANVESVAAPQAITVGAAAGAAGAAAGSATSYIGNGLFTGDMSFGEGFRQTMVGGFSGAISGGTAFGLHQVPWFNLRETGIRSISSSVSSMATALANGDNILDAGLSGLFWGAMASEANVLVSLGLVYSINAFGGTDALNRFYGTENGEWMTEGQSVSTMKPGDVSASVANDWSVLLSLLSGNGPFSHVRGMDKKKDIVESNSSGVGILGGNENHDIHKNRLTYVTKAFRGGRDYGVEARSFLGKGFFRSYVANHLCVGATHKVNPYYSISSPNGLLPWNLRYFYFYHY